MPARAVFASAPEGNYVMINGSPTDPNADVVRDGQHEVLQEAIGSGAVTIVGKAYTDGWLPANAQRNMEQILTAQDNNVDAVVAFIAVLNADQVPRGRLRRMFEDGQIPKGFTLAYGLPISVLVLIIVALVMTILARRIRRGRSIYATGGNPDAAALSGSNTRALTVAVCASLGALCAVSTVFATARLANHTNDIRTLDELRVTVAAVIGGTALAEGICTIYGAILGAVTMQSLQSGMAMVGVDAPFQNIMVGSVLVIAVLIDTVYRRRTGALR